MAGRIRVRSVKRKEIDEDKLALAFLMLAKILSEEEQAKTDDEDDSDKSTAERAEAA